jgi:hypothetical protein
MNTITKIIIGAVLLAVVFFYAGLKYDQSHSATTAASARAAFVGRVGAAGVGAGRLGGGGGVVMGTVLSLDPQGITVSIAGGGSKIIFVATSTSYTTTSAGSPSDINTGDTVVVTGSTNTDGSVTARSIDVRPATTQSANQ